MLNYTQARFSLLLLMVALRQVMIALAITCHTGSWQYLCKVITAADKLSRFYEEFPPIAFS